METPQVIHRYNPEGPAYFQNGGQQHAVCPFVSRAKYEMDAGVGFHFENQYGPILGVVHTKVLDVSVSGSATLFDKERAVPELEVLPPYNVPSLPLDPEKFYIYHNGYSWSPGEDIAHLVDGYYGWVEGKTGRIVNVEYGTAQAPGGHLTRPQSVFRWPREYSGGFNVEATRVSYVIIAYQVHVITYGVPAQGGGVQVRHQRSCSRGDPNSYQVNGDGVGYFSRGVMKTDRRSRRNNNVLNWEEEGPDEWEWGLDGSTEETLLEATFTFSGSCQFTLTSQAGGYTTAVSSPWGDEDDDIKPLPQFLSSPPGSAQSDDFYRSRRKNLNMVEWPAGSKLHWPYAQTFFGKNTDDSDFKYHDLRGSYAITKPAWLVKSLSIGGNYAAGEYDSALGHLYPEMSNLPGYSGSITARLTLS